MIINKIERAFALTIDLIRHLPEEAMIQHLGNLPSNTIGQQIWCVVGARESYLEAIKASKWSGFTCSLKDVSSKEAILSALNTSTETVMNYLQDKELGEIQKDILLDLLEHEVQHHGQFIRYIYGNKYTFPESWNKRYNL